MRSVSLAVGERHELELRGVAGGYSWELELDGPEGVVEIARRPSAPMPAGVEGSVPPASGVLPERFELVGQAPGRVRLRLALRRAWQREAEPLERDEVEVVVDS